MDGSAWLRSRSADNHDEGCYETVSFRDRKLDTVQCSYFNHTEEKLKHSVRDRNCLYMAYIHLFNLSYDVKSF